jgi:hypothetical protein
MMPSPNAGSTSYESGGEAATLASSGRYLGVLRRGRVGQGCPGWASHHHGHRPACGWLPPATKTLRSGAVSAREQILTAKQPDTPARRAALWRQRDSFCSRRHVLKASWLPILASLILSPPPRPAFPAVVAVVAHQTRPRSPSAAQSPLRARLPCARPAVLDGQGLGRPHPDSPLANKHFSSLPSFPWPSTTQQFKPLYQLCPHNAS